MPRDAETVNQYLYETWDQTEDVPCPGCGLPWMDKTPGKPEQGKVRFHTEDCDYCRWLDENADEPHPYRNKSYSNYARRQNDG